MFSQCFGVCSFVDNSYVGQIFQSLTVFPKLGSLSESPGVAIDKHKFLSPTRDLLNFWTWGQKDFFFPQNDPQVTWVMSPILEQMSNGGMTPLKKPGPVLPRGKSSPRPNLG